MAFPTQSVLLTRATPQYFTRAKTGSTNLYQTGAFTVEGFVNITSKPASTNVMTFYSQSWKTGGNLSFLMGLYCTATADTYQLRTAMSSDGTTLNVNATTGTPFVLTAGTWYHLAFVYTPSTSIELFVNGVSTVTYTTSIPASVYNGTDIVAVGIEGDGTSNPFNGRMSLMRVWSSARTAQNITDNWCKELGSTANLGAEWTFDNTANDNSGNSNTLTPVNTPTYAANVPSVVCTGQPTGNFLAFM